MKETIDTNKKFATDEKSCRDVRAFFIRQKFPGLTLRKVRELYYMQF